jgi:uridine kinase
MDYFEVRIKGHKTLKVLRDQTVLDILPVLRIEDKLPPLGAVVNNRLVGLDYRFTADCDLEIVTFLSKDGAAIYRRTVANILLQAIHAVAPAAYVSVGQALYSGYYYDFISSKPLTAALLAKISEEMRRIIKQDRVYIKKMMPVEEAVNFFRQEGMQDKVKLLSNCPLSQVTLVSCGAFTDICFGLTAYSTGVVDKFKLYLKKPGFVVGFPTMKFPRTVPPMQRQPKLFNVYVEARSWYKILGVENVGDLNELCISGKITDMVKIAEGLHEKKIAQIADRIARQRKQIKIVLISGPSASGKTTFAKRLGIQLQVDGIFPKFISLDDYFVDRDTLKKDKNGIADYESIESVDVRLFNKHLRELLDGKTVLAPIFSFSHGKRLKDRTNTLRLDKDEVLIVEGIHGLNNKLTPQIPPRNKFKIYVSALTQLSIDNNNRIFTSDSRLIRRIVRDKLFRTYSAADTLHRWDSVREGERRHIFPFQESADAYFNSSLIYEHAVMKDYAERFLLEVRQDQRAYVEAQRLLEFLSIFVSIPAREVPNTSILREFIGGSTFSY